MPSQADDDAVEDGVGLPVSSSVESVAADRIAGPGGDGTSAAEFGKCGFRSDSVGVVACGDEHLSGGIEPDPEPLEQLGCGDLGERLQVSSVGF